MAIIDSKPLRTAITAVFITSQVYSLDSIKEPVKRGRTVPKISRSTSDIRPLRGSYRSWACAPTPPGVRVCQDIARLRRLRMHRAPTPASRRTGACTRRFSFRGSWAFRSIGDAVRRRNSPTTTNDRTHPRHPNHPQIACQSWS